MDPVSFTHPASDAAAKIAVTSAIPVFIGVFLYSIAPIVLPLLWQILIDFLQSSHRCVATTLIYVIRHSPYGVNGGVKAGHSAAQKSATFEFRDLIWEWGERLGRRALQIAGACQDALARQGQSGVLRVLLSPWPFGRGFG